MRRANGKSVFFAENNYKPGLSEGQDRFGSDIDMEIWVFGKTRLGARVWSEHAR